MKLLPLWIEGLDEMLGGGLPDKSVVLMSGEPGSGHDILAQQIIYQHALHNGKVAYITASRPPHTLREDLATFGWNVAPLEQQKNWIFHQMPATDAIQALTKKISKAIADGRWLLLDSLSYLILTQEYQAIVQIAESLLESARKNGGIHFLLFTQKMHDTKTETTIQHLVDGVIELSAEESGSGIDRRIRIKKMRRAIYEPRLIPFNVTEHGITIETAIRIA